MEDFNDIELLTKCYRDAYKIVGNNGIGDKPEDKVAASILANALFNYRSLELKYPIRTFEVDPKDLSITEVFNIR
jgi:hypothetical protein